MDVTTEMVQAAMRKAAEAGLLPRHARNEEMLINQELMRIVLQAALEAAPAHRTVPNGHVRQRRFLGENASLRPAEADTYRYLAK